MDIDVDVIVLECQRSPSQRPAMLVINTKETMVGYRVVRCKETLGA